MSSDYIQRALTQQQPLRDEVLTDSKKDYIIDVLSPERQGFKKFQPAPVAKKGKARD